MDFRKLGATIASLVVQTTNQHLSKVQGMVSGDGAIVGLNLYILAAWLATKRVLQPLPGNVAGQVLDAMHDQLYRAINRTFWGVLDLGALEQLVRNRYSGYYEAEKAESDSGPVPNIMNYFFASASRATSVGYEEIIPDPEDLALMEEEFPGVTAPNAIEALRRAREENNAPVYPLGGLQDRFRLMDCLAPIVEGVPTMILDFLENEE